MMAINGETVELAYDPLDMGQAAIYYRDRFFGLAKCVELRRMGEALFVQDEKDRRSSRRQVKKAIAAVHAVGIAPSFEERLARRAEILPARDFTRPEMPAQIAGPVVEAAEAARLEAAIPEPTPVEKVASPDAAADDDEFQFFK